MTTFENRTFGVEFEGYNVPMSVLERKLRAAGINAGQSYYSDRNASYWRIKPDGRLRGNNPFEVVSPILQGEAGLAEMKTVLDVCLAAGAEVNISCGFHVHWGVADWDMENFRNLAARYVKFERVTDWLMPPSRRENNQYYCQGWVTDPNYKVSTQKMWNKAKSKKTIKAIQKMLGHGRYYKLNLSAFWSHQTVEFRQHSGTFDYTKAEAWVRLTGAMVAQSSNRDRLQNWRTGDEDKRTALDILIKPMVSAGYLPKTIARIYRKRLAHWMEKAGVTS